MTIFYPIFFTHCGIEKTVFLIQLLTSSLQREAKARNMEAGKEKRCGGGEKNRRKLAGEKKNAV